MLQSLTGCKCLHNEAEKVFLELQNKQALGFNYCLERENEATVKHYLVFGNKHENSIRNA
jgi:hypothetical protein